MGEERGRAIEARGLARVFESRAGRVVALADVSFSVDWGTFCVVRGPSGCGKSTLLNLLGLLDRPSQGHLMIANVEVTSLGNGALERLRREAIGFLFQDGGLIEPMSVAANVELPLKYRRMSAEVRRARVHQALRRVALEHRAASPVGELSGGERQRVGFARALVADTPILVCDEPTASLDPANATLIADLLAERARDGVAVVCASHEPILISRAERIMSLSFGRLTEAVS